MVILGYKTDFFLLISSNISPILTDMQAWTDYRPIYRWQCYDWYRYIGFADKAFIGRYSISADTDMPTLEAVNRELTNRNLRYTLLHATVQGAPWVWEWHKDNWRPKWSSHTAAVMGSSFFVKLRVDTLPACWLNNIYTSLHIIIWWQPGGSLCPRASFSWNFMLIRYQLADSWVEMCS